MTSGCRLIIAFFPDHKVAINQAEVLGLLRTHPLSVERVEETEKGVLVFASSTHCDSLDLTKLRETLLAESRNLGYRLRLQREDLFRAMHSVTQGF